MPTFNTSKSGFGALLDEWFFRRFLKGLSTPWRAQTRSTCEGLPCTSLFTRGGGNRVLRDTFDPISSISILIDERQIQQTKVFLTGFLESQKNH